MTQIMFNSLPLGNSVLTEIPYEYNGLIVSLVNGTAEVYFNANTPGSVPDLVFNPSPNPITIPLPIRKDKRILIRSKATAALPLLGSIWVTKY